MKANVNNGMGVKAEVQKGAAFTLGQFRPRHYYTVECWDRGGNLRWTEKSRPNMVVNEGLDDILDKYYKASAYTSSHFVGLKNTGSFTASSTMSSHAAWTENTTYSNGTRPAFTPGSVASQSVSNTASKATFSISGSTTIYGAFLATNSTKGGSAGVLVGGADFSGSRTVQSGDTLNVTVTASAASS